MNPGFRGKRQNGEFRSKSTFFLFLLLFFPALAFLRLAQIADPWIILCYAVGISAVTYALYKQDKKRAQAGGWRTPEFTLHFGELLGGWPGAFIAQRTLRHKISKTSYQVTFWAIIALHELASFDYIQNWKYVKKAIVFLQQ